MKIKEPFQSYCAIPQNSQYAIVLLSRLGNFQPTECRKFSSFEQADKAAQWMHKERPQHGYINMR